MNTIFTQHPEAVWYEAKMVIVSFFAVSLFQMMTTAAWLARLEVTEVGIQQYAFGLLAAFIFTTVEYLGIDVLRNKWKSSTADNKLTLQELVVLTFYFAIFGVVVGADFYSTQLGASYFIHNDTFTYGWALAQLFLAETLFHAYFHLRDAGEAPAWTRRHEA